MKVLHLISQHPESTGSGFYIQNIIRLAKRAGHQNYLIAGVPSGYSPQLDCIEEKYCSFVTFSGGDLGFAVPGMSDVMPYESSLYSGLSEIELTAYEKCFESKIREGVERFSPDIIHSHHLWLATAVARRTTTIPIVTSCHSTDLRQFVLCPHLQQKVLTGCRGVERVLALGHDQAEKIQTLYGFKKNHIDVVGGGYHKELFYWHKKQTSPPVHLLYAGKLSFAKGVDWLLRCFEKLTHLPVHLHLAGSGTGEEGRVCCELAEKLGERVTIHGRVSQQALAELMRRCHLFILPSFYEGLPLVLLEALASGCRVVTTDLPGCRELLQKSPSDVVEFIPLPEMQEVDRPNPEAWEELETLLVQAIGRMAERAMDKPSPDHVEVERTVGPHDWEAVFERISASYELAASTGM